VLRTPAGRLGQAVRQPVDLRKLLVEGDFRQNLQVRPGDTLFVPLRTPRTGDRSILERAAAVLAPFIYLLW